MIDTDKVQATAAAMVDMIDDATGPDDMTIPEYIECLDTIIVALQNKVTASKSDLEGTDT